MESSMQHTPVIVATPEQLKGIVRDAVDAAFAERAQETAPTLLDRNGLARALGCSAGHVDSLRKLGLPTKWLGDAPRFLLSDVLSWLPSGAAQEEK